MKKKILSLMLIFCLTLVPALCISASANSQDTAATTSRTHMVNLSNYFNRDIFATPNETVDTKWGYVDKISDSSVIHTGLNINKIKDKLDSNGILSGNITKTVINEGEVAETFKNYDFEIPYDLSNITKEKNAIVCPDDNYNATYTDFTTISQDLFSGKSSDYLLLLNAAGHYAAAYYCYTIEYTDGTSDVYRDQSNSWAGVYGETKKNVVLDADLKLYLPTTDDGFSTTVAEAKSSGNFKNKFVLIAKAIPTNGKTIKSFKYKILSRDGNSPILAMTEVLTDPQQALKEKEATLKTNLDAFSDNNITADNYKAVKEIVTTAEYLEKENYTFTLTTEQNAKFTKLKKQFNVVRPHTVDLTSYFNRDIFAKVGETVGSDWGFADRIDSIDTKQTGINIANVESELNNGILSDGKASKVIGAVDWSDCAVAISDVAETPYDLSNIDKTNNAIVSPYDRTDGTWSAVTTISADKFSSKPSDYLLILVANGHRGGIGNYTVEFSDGSSLATGNINYSWIGAYGAQGSGVKQNTYLMDVGERLYVSEAEGSSSTTLKATKKDYVQNNFGLMALALPTNGKTVTSFKFKTICNSGGGNTPILAMTEVTKVTAFSDKATELETILTGMVDSNNNPNGDIISLEDQTNAKKAIELATYLENGGYELSAETKAKIEKLTKQYNGVKPYMVDLSNAFNRDIFANVDETVDSNWGYKEKLADGSKNENSSYNQFVKTIGINLDTVKGALNSEGILSSDKVAPIIVRNNTTLATDEVVRNYALSTPFDLSHIEEGKNAIVHDASCYETVVNTTVEIEKNAKGENVFSGKPSKYLAVLSSVSNGTQSEFYTITFTDGTTEEFRIEYPWSGNFGDTQYTLNVGPNVSVDENSKVVAGKEYNYNHLNRNVLLTSVIPTNGKTIKSISNRAHACYGVTPVLAMTEIPLDYTSLFANASDIFTGAITTVTKDNAADVLNKSVSAIEFFERGYFDKNDESLSSYYNNAVALNKQAQSILKFGDKEFYVENTFEEKDGKVLANVTLANTSSENTTYVLIIGAYSDNGQKLEDYKCSETKTFNVTGNEINDSVDLPINDKATSYKLFVWKSLDSLSPIATFVK